MNALQPEQRRRQLLLALPGRDARRVDGPTARDHQAHPGRIWLESALGVGTTIYVALPTPAALD